MSYLINQIRQFVPEFEIEDEECELLTLSDLGVYLLKSESDSQINSIIELINNLSVHEDEYYVDLIRDGFIPNFAIHELFSQFQLVHFQKFNETFVDIFNTGYRKGMVPYHLRGK
jgi:hypothetical protein